MKRLLIATLLISIFFSAVGQDIQPVSSIIPVPVSMQAGTGNFIIKNTSGIELSGAAVDAKRRLVGSFSPSS